MSISINSPTHASTALPAAQAAPQATTASPLPQTAKTTSLPQDTVKLSSQAQAAPAAQGTSDVAQNGDNH
jgi:hypothetical protein